MLVVSLACLGSAIQGPRSECYTLDNSNYLYDFVSFSSVNFYFKGTRKSSAECLQTIVDNEFSSGKLSPVVAPLYAVKHF